MAEIIINGPDGISTINNIPAWATEATQNIISKTLTGIGTSSKKIEALLSLQLKGYTEVTKATKEGDKEIADLLDTIRKLDKEGVAEQKKTKQATMAQTKAVDDLEQLQKDSLSELGKLNDSTNQQNKDLDKILNDMNTGSDGLMSFAGGFGKGGNLLGGALGIAAKAAGLFGTAILGVATYIGSQFTETFKFLNNGLRQGTGGIIGLTHPVENVAMAANMAGMSLEEFGTFAQQNSKILRVMGAKGFTDLYSKTLIATGGLLDIGMTADDAVESVMTELEYRRRFGMMLNQDTAVLRASLMTSARELRIFANAVGMSEDELRTQSEVQEDHVQLMRLRTEQLGGSTLATAEATQRISRELGALGLGDLINPLFESVSKGSTGLSDSFIEIGKVAPDLITMVEGEAANFRQTGILNANLGRDIINLMKGLTSSQLDAIEALQTAGDAGSVTLNNMVTNLGKYTPEMIAKMLEPMDEKSLTLLDTFNRLGFVVNQSTATIGDMGKTALLALLGFDKAADGTFDFNHGISVMSDKILQFSKNIFGSNSRITESVGLFTNYLDTMFGGIQEGEDTEAFQKRLDDARTAFVNTVGGFAQRIGLDLNDQIKQGTLFDTIKRFFLKFFDDLSYAIATATGGILFGGSADRGQTRQFMAGNMSNDAYLKTVGINSVGDREAMTDLVFKDQITQKADELGISNNLSQQVASGYAVFGKDNKATKVVMNDLRNSITGFEDLSISEQKSIFNDRVSEVALFNNNVNDYVLKMYAEVEDGLDLNLRIANINKYMKWSADHGYTTALAGLDIFEDIDGDSLYKFKDLFRTNTAFGGSGQTSFMGNDAFLQDQVKRLAINKSTFDTLGNETYKSANNDQNVAKPMSFKNSAKFVQLQEDYFKAMEDGQMHFSEATPMQALIKELRGSGTMSNDTTLLLESIKNLIDKQRELTNQMKDVINPEAVNP